MSGHKRTAAVKPTFIVRVARFEDPVKNKFTPGAGSPALTGATPFAQRSLS